MALPPLASIPPSEIRAGLETVEWNAFLDAWKVLVEAYVRLSAKELSSAVSSGAVSGFLRSYYNELAHLDARDETLRSAKAYSLQKASFALVRRVLVEASSLGDLLDLDFLSDFCRAHVRSARLPSLLDESWDRRQNDLQKPLQSRKTVLTMLLDSSAPDTAEVTLSQTAPIIRGSTDVAVFFMTGSDFLDSLASGYAKAAAERTRKAITMTTYLGLVACVTGKTSNASMLSDHLYSLKSQAEGRAPNQSLLADLVTNTPLLGKLRKSLSGKTPERLVKLLDALDTFRAPSIARQQRRPRRKAAEGKASANGPMQEMHVHRMSLVTQVQDLFPDLGAGFVLRLLDEYGDDVEQVTAHLLDDTLPPYLQTADRNEQAPIFDTDAQQAVDHLAPSSTPPPPPPEPYIPDRRNVYDDDELDQLQMDTARLHIGKRKDTSRNDQPNKSAIMAALAAFDSDDDERDDTYDVEDVGGTIDSAHPEGEPGTTATMTGDENEMALFTAYRSSPALFGRTFDVRRGQPRAALKAETGMTDEAIEGWAIMLQRDPMRLRKLEAQMGSFDGKQTELARTAFRDSAPGTETEDSDAPADGAGRGRGGFRGRGRGRGRGGRGGGNVAGPSGDAATVQAQRRKEENKGSRANHNRRNQRAKKMARGGFPE